MKVKVRPVHGEKVSSSSSCITDTRQPGESQDYMKPITFVFTCLLLCYWSSQYIFHYLSLSSPFFLKEFSTELELNHLSCCGSENIKIVQFLVEIF